MFEPIEVDAAQRDNVDLAHPVPLRQPTRGDDRRRDGAIEVDQVLADVLRRATG